jgi:hypothetical protein
VSPALMCMPASNGRGAFVPAFDHRSPLPARAPEISYRHGHARVRKLTGTQ